MPVRLALLIDDANARRLRGAERAQIVLLARTLIDPPRAAACRRWGEMLRRSFPEATLIPYAWHLVTHGPEDGLRKVGSRELSGPPEAFGRLVDTPSSAQAMEVVRTCAEALGTTTIAIRTPPSLTPGAIGRKRLADFHARQAATGFSLVWEPEGLWTPEEAMALSAPLSGMELLVTAFEGGRPRRSEADDRILGIRGAWLRIDGAGPRRTVHGGHLDAIAEHVDADPRATLVFAGPRAVTNLTMAADALAADGLL